MGKISKLWPILALLTPSVASAQKVVLTPLLSDDTVNDKQQVAVRQLISSELDFSPGVSGVVELQQIPSGLNDGCLNSARCLGGLTSANGGEQMITGRMSSSGSGLVLDLLLYANGQIVRRKAFNVPQDPTGLANSMTPVIQEVLTGNNPTKSAAATPTASDFDLEEDFDDERDAQLAAIDAAAAGIAGGAAVAVAPPPAPNPDADVANINFGNAVNDISAEEIDQMIQFGAPPGVGGSASTAPMPAPMPRAQPRPIPEGMSDPDLAVEAALANNAGTTEPAQGRRRDRASRPVRSSTSSSTRVQREDTEQFVQVTGRGGFCKYYTFDFITAGAEAAIRVSGNVHLLAGMEAYAVNRVLPPEVALERGVLTEWNTIFPLNAGVVYKVPVGIAEPYVGADAIFVQYYRDAVGSDWAGGARLRAGVDLMFVPNFGLNVNLAAGGWSGQNWELIELGVRSSGFIPQISAGTVIAF